VGSSVCVRLRPRKAGSDGVHEGIQWVSASRADLFLESDYPPSSGPLIFRLNRAGGILALIDVKFSIDLLAFWTR